VHKGTAVEHLRKASSAGRPLVVCGDSENDLGMLRVADVAVIMADSQLRDLQAGSSARVVRPRSPGPAGILEVLLALAQPEPAVSDRHGR
jgi:hydroxymethylpyrimidine pyrophosphatase-like HAD family hydrolase